MNKENMALVGNIDQQIIDNIKANPKSIKEYAMTPELCMYGVLIEGRILRYIPKNMHTRELCLAAVSENGAATKYVSKKIIDNEICLKAVMSNGEAIQYIPKEKLTNKIKTEALKQNGTALRHFSEKSRTQKRCGIAVRSNGLALQYVPTSVLSKDIIKYAIVQNGMALEYVPGNRKTKKLCIQAVESDPLSLEFVPKRFRTIEMCEKLLDSNWRVFPFLLQDMYTIETCKNTLDRVIGFKRNIQKVSYSDKGIINLIARSIPKEISSDMEVIRRLRDLKFRIIKLKEYDVISKKFRVIENFKDESEEEVINEFSSFEEYCNFLGGDLKGAKLLNYDFKGIDINKYDLREAYVQTEILIENGLYDDTFYSKSIKGHKAYSEIYISDQSGFSNENTVLHEAQVIGRKRGIEDICFYYISDIHLNKKLDEKYTKYGTKFEITSYIHGIVDDMMKSALEKRFSDVLLVTGDVSYDIEISRIFYKELKRRWSQGKIMVVLGNHELWDYKFECSDLEYIIQKYRELFEEIGIIFLQNDLVLMGRSEEPQIVREDILNQLSSDNIREMCKDFSIAILGGIGFSGLSAKYNATCGLYRKTVPTLEKDIEETKRFNDIYLNIMQAIPRDKVIVMTHTPKSNWSNKSYNPNWIYVNGHTHINKYCNDDNKCIYADNQIGYNSKTISLKEFQLKSTHDIFEYYSDGVYDISKEQYMKFYRNMGIGMEYNRNSGSINMLKKDGFYCFLIRDRGILYLLDGGRRIRMDVMDIEYYYDKMGLYSEKIKEICFKYTQIQKRLSEEIIKIGGDGTIHGCIIDIDYYNHIYLNPVDGTIKPYYAESIVNKWIYNSVEGLLLERRPDLHDMLIEIKNKGIKNVLTIRNEESNEISFNQFFTDTSMYQYSGVMKSFQYLTQSKIIRTWKEEIINK